MVYGANMDKGLVLDGLKLKSVTIGQDGYTMDDVLVHDAHEKDNTLHMMLAMMSGDMPIALGVIRDVEGPTYDEAVHQQIEEVQAKNPTRKLHDLLMKGEIWEVSNIFLIGYKRRRKIFILRLSYIYTLDLFVWKKVYIFVSVTIKANTYDDDFGNS